MVQLSLLTDKKMRRNEEKREGKIRPPDSYKYQANTLVKAAPKWSKGGPKIESGPPRNGVRVAPK